MNPKDIFRSTPCFNQDLMHAASVLLLIQQGAEWESYHNGAWHDKDRMGYLVNPVPDCPLVCLQSGIHIRLKIEHPIP